MWSKELNDAVLTGVFKERGAAGEKGDLTGRYTLTPHRRGACILEVHVGASRIGALGALNCLELFFFLFFFFLRKGYFCQNCRPM